MKLNLGTKFTEEILSEFLTDEKFMAAAIIASENSDWKLSFARPRWISVHTDKGLFARNYEITIKREGDAIKVTSETLGNALVDIGDNNKNNVLSFIAEFNRVISDLPEELVTQKLEEKNEYLLADDGDASTRGALATLFLPSKDGLYITPVLLSLNVLVFILMAFAGAGILEPEVEVLYQWGANYGPATLNGEWWRILSCMFIHIGVIHLAMNMYALLYIGLFLEPILGRVKYASAYILTGVTASLLSLYVHPDILSAGASGAIFGMFGVFLALLTTNVIKKDAKKTLLPTIAIYVGYNLLFGMKEGIDNAGHIGGLIGGFVIGYLLLPSIKKREARFLEWSTIGGITVLLSIVAVFSFKATHNSVTDYNSEVERYRQVMGMFSQEEEKALAAFKIADTSMATQLHAFSEDGLERWYRCDSFLTEIDSMKLLPEKIHFMNQQLRQYCALRIESYELICKKIAEKTYIYDPKIESVNADIASLLKELNAEEEKAE